MADQRVAVDANNILWTFVTGMARGGAPTGPQGRSISHLIGLLHRCKLYAKLDWRPVWVFDGAAPELKRETLQERRARRKAARQAGDEVQGARLDDWQIDEAQALLDALGIPWIQAPGEADAQLAAWTAQGRVEAAITQDYDCALFGCPSTYRNVSKNGSRDPERIDLEEALRREEISRTQLVDASILIGTDYNEGIHGVGPVRALRLVREHGDVWGALEAKGHEMQRAEPVRRLLLDPRVRNEAPPTGAPPDRERVRDLLAPRGLEGRAHQAVKLVEDARVPA